MSSVIEILVLRALALKKRGDPSEALAALERALTLAEPEGYVRVFVDEGEPLAALLSELLNAQRKGSREARHRILLAYVKLWRAPRCRCLTAKHTATVLQPGWYVPVHTGQSDTVRKDSALASTL